MAKRVSAAVCRFVLLLAIVASVLMPAAAADEVHLAKPVKITMFVDSERRELTAVEAGFEFSTYVSLRSLATALKGTPKQFGYSYIRDYYGAPAYIVVSGNDYSDGDGSLEKGESVYLALNRYRLIADERERKYYAYNYGDNDLFMSLADIQLMLDVQIAYLPSGELSMVTGEPFRADLPGLLEDGRLESVRALAVGDVNTGEIMFGYDSRRPLSIASMSKLMTYVLLREAIDKGAVKYDDAVSASPAVIELAKSENGMLPIKEGTVLTLNELTQAMLVPSSNEATLAIAGHVAGSEENFVRMMNLKARQLNLKSAVFMNCHGLPIYTKSTVPAKRQNVMSAEDMFELVSYIMLKYPDITEITSKQYVTFPSLNYSAANSNPLVFNMEGVTGLKTGTTDRAGYSLAATRNVTVDGETHTLAVIELGAETPADRGIVSEIALRWAESFCRANGFAHSRRQ